MPDTFTPALNLTKPEVGASRDSWGSKTNLNWDTLDQFVSQAMPIGSILDFAGPNAPSGWLICDGRTISRVTYSALFAVIGTAWGVGDGSTTFALPDTRGRSGVGAGTVTDQGGLAFGFGYATKWGYVYQTITQNNLPNYMLTTTSVADHNHTGSTSASAVSGMTDSQGQHSHLGQTGGSTSDHTHSGVTNFTGEHTHQYLQATTGSGSLAAGGSAMTIAAQTATSNGGAANHQHSFTTGGFSNDHAHAITADGSHAHNVNVAAHTHGINFDGGHAHTMTLGGGGVPMVVMSPTLTVTKIIYAGSQASTRAALDAASVAPSAADSTDEMAAIREELAALRALFAPAARRVPTTPLRGMN